MLVLSRHYDAVGTAKLRAGNKFGAKSGIIEGVPCRPENFVFTNPKSSMAIDRNSGISRNKGRRMMARMIPRAGLSAPWRPCNYRPGQSR